MLGMEKIMTNPKWNDIPPVTQHGRRGVQVPLDVAISNPNTILNTTPKTYLPAQPNVLPPQKPGKQ